MIYKRPKNIIYSGYRKIKNYIYPAAIILMYHRVAELETDPHSIAVSQKHFTEHLEIIRKHGNPLSLQQLRNRLSKNKSVKRSIVVTFDDGYADNLYNAKPLLEKYDVPATVFVASGFVDQKNECWWDELDRILLQPGNLPELLELQIRGISYQWELGDTVYYNKEDLQLNSYYRMRSKPKHDPTQRHSLYRALHKLLRHLTFFERDKVMNELFKWANVDRVCRQTHRTLSSDEVIQLDQGGLVDVGAHTVSHPYLSKIPINLQKYEIQKSKECLENLLDREVNSFAYPHGDFNDITKLIVKEAGFNCALSTISGKVKKNCDLFMLPRVEVNNWDGEELGRKLLTINY